MQGKETIIYAMLIGAALGDLLPTAADALYFNLVQKLDQKQDEGKITPKQKWLWETFYYYTLNPAYWLLIALLLYTIRADYHFKVKLLLILLASGMVVVVINKNIKKDTLRLKLKNSSAK